MQPTSRTFSSPRTETPHSLTQVSTPNSCPGPPPLHCLRLSSATSGVLPRCSHSGLACDCFLSLGVKSSRLTPADPCPSSWRLNHVPRTQMLPSAHPFICWWTSGWLLLFDYGDQCCSGHGYTNLSAWPCFLLGCTPRAGTAGSECAHLYFIVDLSHALVSSLVFILTGLSGHFTRGALVCPLCSF